MAAPPPFLWARLPSKAALMSASAASAAGAAEGS